MKHFPALTKAATLMARCNGGINRMRSLRQFENKLSNVLEHSPHDLAAIDRWLATQNDDDLLTIVDGEETEIQAAMSGAPPGTDMLLNDIFDRAV